MLDLRKLVIMVIIPGLILLNLPVTAMAGADDGGPSLEITHTPISTIQTGQAFEISANLSDREGIELVRIYFRTKGTKSFFFVPMIVSKGTDFYGLLPPPSTPGKIEYLFLVKTYNNRIFNSETFTVTVKRNKAAGFSPEKEPIDVMTELSAPPKRLPGFGGPTKIRTVTKHEKHGVLAGLYNKEPTGGSASNGRYHGTVTRSSKSNTNMLFIAGGVAAAAIVVGLAAGGSSSGGGSSTTTPVEPVDDSTGMGTWTLQFDYAPCFRTTSQIVECSTEGLVTSVAPSAIGIPLPPDCANAPFNGISDVFVIGGSCDSVTACTNYSASDLVSKTCEDKAMIFNRQEGNRVERWSVQ